MKKWMLNNEWTLCFTNPKGGQRVNLPAKVPGNVELELMEAGLVKDYWPADEVYATREFEAVDDWTYETSFDMPNAPENHTLELVFEGIDTIADIELNGKPLLSTRSMFIEHRADVRGLLKDKGNTLKVVIRSATLYARQFEYDAFGVSRLNTEYKAQTYLRKARHQWGWDNAPRLLTSGIWRPVYLEARPLVRFEDVYVYTKRIRGEICQLGVDWAVTGMDADLSAYSGEMLLSFGGKEIHKISFGLEFIRGRLDFTLPLKDIALWWPVGFGEPNRHDLTLLLKKDSEVIARYDTKWGIRTIELCRTPVIHDDGTGDFVFIVNNERIYINGTNWKPLDALHSRAEERVKPALDLTLDMNCNMVRVWGGGVYESEAFFDYCDEKGLLIWQDFMMACEFPPRDEWYLKQVADETVQIVKQMRNHCSLAVWCGDNEIDMAFTWNHLIPTEILPSDNLITRQVFKDVVLRYDPYRSYVESSPYMDDDIARAVHRDEPTNAYLPEEHLYPPSADFHRALRECQGRFIGETGPIVVNAMTDNPAIVERELPRARRLWDAVMEPNYNNSRHQTDIYFTGWRQVGRELTGQYFGRDFTVDEWKDYTLAINILCGNIFKDSIEYSRSMKWEKTGVLWWSLLDMWPMMFNYSVIDYDFQKKLPYYWIKQSQQAFCLMMVRRELGGEIALYAANDTLCRHSGTYEIRGIDENGKSRSVASGIFDEPPNRNRLLQQLPECGAELWMIEWTEHGKTCHNHFITGEGPYNFDAWQRWIGELNKAYGV